MQQLRVSAAEMPVLLSHAEHLVCSCAAHHIALQCTDLLKECAAYDLQVIFCCQTKGSDQHSAGPHLDLDSEFSSLVDAQLLLRLMRVRGELQLVQQVHLSATVEEDIDPCSSWQA